jgi:hypothetical protein
VVLDSLDSFLQTFFILSVLLYSLAFFWCFGIIGILDNGIWKFSYPHTVTCSWKRTRQ